MTEDDWPPPYEYLGRPTAWSRLVHEYGDPVLHTHNCPECYERVTCLEQCTLEPDLEDNGVPSGNYMECRRCQREAYYHAEREETQRHVEVAKEQLFLFENLGA